MTPAKGPVQGSKAVDAYLAAQPDDVRVTLEKVRATVTSAVPKGTEAISYGIPTLKLDGRAVVWYAGFKNHCSLFPVTNAVRKELADELGRYETSKGTLRFPIGKPPSARFIRKLVRTRIAENEGRAT